MANSFTNVTPTLLAQGLKALREMAIMPRLVNRDIQPLAAEKGAVINVPIPSVVTASAVTPALTWASGSDSAPTVAPVTLDFWREASFYLTDQQLQEAMDGVIPMQATEAVRALANAIDAYILGKYTGIYGYVGTGGTTPFASGVTVASQGRTVLNKQVAPMGPRFGVLDPDAEGAFLMASPILLANERGDQQAVINGSIGRKLGFDWYMDQNVVTHTAGTAFITGWTITGGAAAGATNILINSASAPGSIVVGDIFTVAGSTQTYVARANVTVAASTTSVTLTILPALVSAAASGAALTVKASHVVNLLAHRDAFAWASRPMQDIQGLGNAISSVADPVSGIALRLEVARLYKKTAFSFDVLGGAGLIRPELACIIAG